jgi:hypothetical protein
MEHSKFQGEEKKHKAGYESCWPGSIHLAEVYLAGCSQNTQGSSRKRNRIRNRISFYRLEKGSEKRWGNGKAQTYRPGDDQKADSNTATPKPIHYVGVVATVIVYTKIKQVEVIPTRPRTTQFRTSHQSQVQTVYPDTNRPYTLFSGTCNSSSRGGNISQTHTHTQIGVNYRLSWDGRWRKLGP